MRRTYHINRRAMSGGFFFFVLAVLLTGFGGWVANIVKLVGAGPLVEWTAMEVLRIAGIFVPPLGAVLGFL